MTKTPAPRCCPVLELRQYTLKPGQRDVLIDLFEREFVETQEAVGILLVGQFRDLDRPDRFVWIRGFSDMPSRAEALQAFYGGPVWQAHRDAANATMIDSDNVLLLRPVSADSAFADGNARSDRRDSARVVAHPRDDLLPRFACRRKLRTILRFRRRAGDGSGRRDTDRSIRNRIRRKHIPASARSHQ